MTRAELDALRDRLYVLACAIDDYEQSDELERPDALEELLHAARTASTSRQESHGAR